MGPADAHGDSSAMRAIRVRLRRWRPDRSRRPTRARKSIQRLSNQGLFVVGVLAALAVLSYLVLASNIETNEATAAQLTLSGSQVHLAQQALLLANQFSANQDPDVRVGLRDQLVKVAVELEANHLALVSGDLPRGLAGNPPPAVRAVYYDPPYEYDLELRRFVGELYALTLGADARGNESAAVSRIRGLSPLVQAGAMLAHEGYLAQSELTLAQAKRVAMGVLLANLAALVGAAFVVFRPIVSRVYVEMKKLGELNETLEFRVVERTQMAEQRAEQLRLSEERLRELESFRKQMLHNISHDLATPITPIRLQLYIMEKTLKDGGVPDSKALQIMNRNVEQLHRLLEDLKDLARLEAGGLRIHAKPLDLAGLVHDATESFRAAIVAQGVQLELAMDGPLPIEADEQRVTQVLFNLLTNAIKFTPSGGRIRVEGLCQDSQAVVRVRDTGRGLTQEEIERLFRPFVQVHHPGEVKEKGSGLGLYICRGLIERHGGRIWVESEGLTRGACFSFALPLRGTAPAAPAGISAPSPSS